MAPDQPEDLDLTSRHEETPILVPVQPGQRATILLLMEPLEGLNLPRGQLLEDLVGHQKVQDHLLLQERAILHQELTPHHHQAAVVEVAAVVAVAVAVAVQHEAEVEVS